MKKLHEYTIDEIQDLTKVQINKIYRHHDESHKWPICNKFNATERAIRRLRKLNINGGYEYWLALGNELTFIVNKEV